MFYDKHVMCKLFSLNIKLIHFKQISGNKVNINSRRNEIEFASKFVFEYELSSIERLVHILALYIVRYTIKNAIN